MVECDKLIDICMRRWSYTSGVVIGLASQSQNNGVINQLFEQIEEGTDELTKMVAAIRQLIIMTR